MRSFNYPTYKVLPIQSGGGSYVLITFANGEEEKWYGFLTEAQARGWAATEIEKRWRNKFETVG